MMRNDQTWDELIDRYLSDELSESEKERLSQALDSDPAAREDFVKRVGWSAKLADHLVERNSNFDTDNYDIDDVPDANRLAVASMNARRLGLRMLLGIATLAALLLLLASIRTALRASNPATPAVATLAGMSGPLVWTGDGGHVVTDLQVGQQLTGGTIEGTGPQSWAELRFNDGSTFTVLGNSVVTFADNGQKELRIREGIFSADVQPQPAGKPMLVRTRSTVLEVVGTRFEVNAELASTSLNVTEGAVRLMRLSDGSEIDVPANHRVVATPDSEMTLVSTADVAHRWESQIASSPEGLFGQWIPTAGGLPASLKAIPLTIADGRTIYATGIGVTSQGRQAVVITPQSQVHFSGRLKEQHLLYFGVTLRSRNGDFAGRFQEIRPAVDFGPDREFHVELSLGDFHLDPSLKHVADSLPTDLTGLVVESVWCHSLFEPVGLAINSVELAAE